MATGTRALAAVSFTVSSYRMASVLCGVSGGTLAVYPALGKWIAQRVADELGTAVRAPTARVGVERLGARTNATDRQGRLLEGVFLPMLEGG